MGDRLSTFNLAGIGHAQVVVPALWAEKISTVRFVGIGRSRSPQEIEQWNMLKLGRTGLEVSRICLGCMSYGVPDRGNHARSIDEAERYPA